MILLPVKKAPNEIIPFDDPRIKYPMCESRKLDGFRAVTDGRRWITSRLKDHANKELSGHFFDLCVLLRERGLIADGELWSETLSFSNLSGVLRSHHETLGDTGFYIFDLLTSLEWSGPSLPSGFGNRYRRMLNMIDGFPNVFILPQVYVTSASEAETRYNTRIERGEEGSMLVNPFRGYKHNRATHNESWLLKFKNFITSDAPIISVIRQNKMIDGIERTRDAGGYLERSHHKFDYEPDDKIAGFNVLFEGLEVGIKAGKGFTDDDKIRWFHEWQANPSSFIGRQVEFSWMPHGTKDRPRIGSLVRFRDV